MKEVGDLLYERDFSLGKRELFVSIMDEILEGGKNLNKKPRKNILKW